jgi:hypothetical protein
MGLKNDLEATLIRDTNVRGRLAPQLFSSLMSRAVNSLAVNLNVAACR